MLRRIRRFLATRCGKATAAVLLPVLLFLAIPPKLMQDVSFSRAVLDRSGTLMRLTLSGDDKYRLFTPLDKISPVLVDAVLLHEDKYFYDHPGVNPVALLRAAWRHIVGGGRGGASTLTMQLARLKYGIHSRSLAGKAWQMAEALRIELHYSKKEILEAYLNLAPYGTNIEGVGAASDIYFGRGADTLSLPEALTLAVVPQSPVRRTPGRNAATDAALLAARGRLFDEWKEIHPGDVRYASLLTRPMHYGARHDIPFIAPQYTTRLIKERTEGTMTTTLDAPLQQQLSGIVHRYVNNHGELNIANAAALLVDTRDMSVVASVGSADYFDSSHLGMLDGTRARRSPGSALKPFIYALGFDQGVVHPLSLMIDAPHTFAGYTPENFDHHYEGAMSAHDALIKSRNIPALWLSSQLAHPDFYHFLSQAEIARLKPEKTYGLSLALGAEEVTMEELVQLYAMLANDGMHADLRHVKGEILPAPHRLLSPEASFMVLDILKDVQPPGGSAEADTLPLPVYWKTGTSGGYRDAWSVGVFGPYVLAVWAGDFHGRTHGQYVGIVTAAPLFFELVRAVTAKDHPQDLIEAKASHLHLARSLACSDTGDIDTPLCPVREHVWLIPGVSPIKPTGIYRRVLINHETGLLACRFKPGSTDYRIIAFWPSGLNEVFKKAGITKPPPPAWEKGCEVNEAAAGDHAPHIVSPVKGVSYHIRDGADNRLPLKASFDGSAHNVFWFVDNVPLAKAGPQDDVFWPLKRGRHVVRVIDDAGNADSRVIAIE